MIEIILKIFGFTCLSLSAFILCILFGKYLIKYHNNLVKRILNED